jgi:methionine-rich copper-binding protein CopC
MKKSKLKIILIAIFVILAILSVIFIISSTGKKNIPTSTPTIKSITPADNSTGFSVFDPVKITFNQTIDPSAIEVASFPSENWSVSQTAQDTVNLNHESYLRVATSYKVTISYNGESIETINFETANSQNDPRQLQSLQSELDKNYPLASLTPYETPDYRVVYSAPLTFEIDIKGNLSEQEAISQVQSWVKSNGVDPSTHKYIVTTPSPKP